MSKTLRSGFTTGTCAAAAAGAATVAIVQRRRTDHFLVWLPDGTRVAIPVARTRLAPPARGLKATACVVKDAGDDPDVTNGAEICASVTVYCQPQDTVPDRRELSPEVRILGGTGVGTVTKRGLPVEVGEPAINPVPRIMIRRAVLDALAKSGIKETVRSIDVTVSVPRGNELARKTLNRRLGILGGLSILGTTGIVRPVSADAWTATIRASMDVARAAGIDEIVLSTGRTSEKAIMARTRFPEEAFVMMGDYLEYALKASVDHKFQHIHLAGMWAKLVKAASGKKQTHVRHGALDVEVVCNLLKDFGADRNLLTELSSANTGREIFDRLLELGREDLIKQMCRKARTRAERYTGGIPVSVYLVHHTGRIIAEA